MGWKFARNPLTSGDRGGVQARMGSGFRPAWWLPGPQPSDLWPSIFRRRGKPALERERIELPDGDFLDLDWNGPDAPDAPLALLLQRPRRVERFPLRMGNAGCIPAPWMARGGDEHSWLQRRAEPARKKLSLRGDRRRRPRRRRRSDGALPAGPSSRPESRSAQRPPQVARGDRPEGAARRSGPPYPFPSTSAAAPIGWRKVYQYFIDGIWCEIWHRSVRAKFSAWKESPIDLAKLSRGGRSVSSTTT